MVEVVAGVPTGDTIVGTGALLLVAAGDSGDRL
jgi:hypothetical protein